jgi:hypothetical protein
MYIAFREPSYKSMMVKANELTTGSYLFLCTTTSDVDIEFGYPGVAITRIEKSTENEEAPVWVFAWDSYSGEVTKVELHPASIVSITNVLTRWEALKERLHPSA